MNSRQPTLMEVLKPRFFQSHPKRVEVTTTVLQPEVDKFGELEASSDVPGSAMTEAGSVGSRSARNLGRGRRSVLASLAGDMT